MAKLFGLNGYATGKLGNNVLVVSNGIQIARQYQPNVHNPKSPLQSSQRAKGNLAGRISALTPRTAIVGLGGNNRTRRAAFLSNILINAVATSSDNVWVAKINSEDICFSKGATAVSFYAPGIIAQEVSVSVTLTGSTAIDPNIYESMQTRLVAMIYDLTTQDLVEVVTRIATKPVQDGSATTNLLVSHSGGYIADVYAIPMSTADGSASSITTSIAGLDDSDIAAELSINRNAVVFQYGRSLYLGQSTYTPQP